MKLLEMPWPTETPCGATPLSVGVGDGERGSPAHRGLSAVPDLPPIFDLPTKVEFMRWCEVCEQVERFVAAWECMYGLVGCCLGCGDERVLLWSRTNSEVA